jgi:hypothetical protein
VFPATQFARITENSRSFDDFDLDSDFDLFHEVYVEIKIEIKIVSHYLSSANRRQQRSRLAMTVAIALRQVQLLYCQ